jgi:hypothetical protein
MSSKGVPGLPKCPEGTFGHMPGNRQLGALPRSAQRRALGNTGTPIDRQVYAAERHGGLSITFTNFEVHKSIKYFILHELFRKYFLWT